MVNVRNCNSFMVAQSPKAMAEMVHAITVSDPYAVIEVIQREGNNNEFVVIWFLSLDSIKHQESEK